MSLRIHNTTSHSHYQLVWLSWSSFLSISYTCNSTRNWQHDRVVSSVTWVVEESLMGWHTSTEWHTCANSPSSAALTSLSYGPHTFPPAHTDYQSYCHGQYHRVVLYYFFKTSRQKSILSVFGNAPPSNISLTISKSMNNINSTLAKDTAPFELLKTTDGCQWAGLLIQQFFVFCKSYLLIIRY